MDEEGRRFVRRSLYEQLYSVVPFKILEFANLFASAAKLRQFGFDTR